ncbi:MAG: GNAT family N-acetyltransferase [Clostridia bacterium]|nr:GNAT family N-acetyltransferase [Clostridia bacterium]
MEKTFVPIEYRESFKPLLMSFLIKCLPESGRTLDLAGRHKYYSDIEKNFKGFWCMFDDEGVIGTSAVSELDEKSCELKSLFLLERYHGLGYGRLLLWQAIAFAAESGYERMYLESLSSSTRALNLYKKAGFTDTQKYNTNEYTDVFMVLDLKSLPSEDAASR